MKRFASLIVALALLVANVWAAVAGSVTLIGAGSPSVLPLSLSGTPTAVYSSVRFSSWTGNYAQVVRASDGATFNIPFRNNVPDYQAAIAFAGGSPLTYSIVYDQSGNGFNMTQATTANQPSFGATSLVGGIEPVIFDGIASSVSKFMLLPSGISVSRVNFSVFQVLNAGTSYFSQGFLEWFDTGGYGTTMHSLTLSGDAPYDTGLASYDTLGIYLSGVRPRAQMMVQALRSGVSNQNFTVNGTKVSAAASAAGTMNHGAQIGTTVFGAAYQLRGDLFAMVIYPTALNDTDHDAVVAKLNTAFRVPQAFSTRLIYGGASDIYSLGSTLNQVITRKINMPPNVEVYNLGISGLGQASQFANRANIEFPLYDATKAVNIIAICQASNDIANTTFSSSADAVTQVTNLYYNVTVPFVQAIQALGGNAKAFIPTIVSRVNFDTTSNWKETARTTYNNLVTAGAATYGYTVSDRASHPAFSAQNSWSDTTYYADSVHPTDLGYSIIAAIDRAALMTLVQ